MTNIWTRISESLATISLPIVSSLTNKLHWYLTRLLSGSSNQAFCKSDGAKVDSNCTLQYYLDTTGQKGDAASQAGDAAGQKAEVSLTLEQSAFDLNYSSL